MYVMADDSEDAERGQATLVGRHVVVYLRGGHTLKGEVVRVTDSSWLLLQNDYGRPTLARWSAVLAVVAYT